MSKPHQKHHLLLVTTGFITAETTARMKQLNSLTSFLLKLSPCSFSARQGRPLPSQGLNSQRCPGKPTWGGGIVVTLLFSTHPTSLGACTYGSPLNTARRGFCKRHNSRSNNIYGHNTGIISITLLNRWVLDSETSSYSPGFPGPSLDNFLTASAFSLTHWVKNSTYPVRLLCR